MKSIGKNLKSLRQKKNWNQNNIAAKLNISVPAYSKIESGITTVNMTRLAELAEIFQVSIFDLMSEEGSDSGNGDTKEIVRLKEKITEKNLETINC
jgi:transcriptional regulator with XRE-family HTH domain